MWLRYVAMGFSVLNSRISQTCPPNKVSHLSSTPSSTLRVMPCKTPEAEKQSLAPKDREGKRAEQCLQFLPPHHGEGSRSWPGRSREEKAKTLLKEITLVGRSIPALIE